MQSGHVRLVFVRMLMRWPTNLRMLKYHYHLNPNAHLTTVRQQCPSMSHCQLTSQAVAENEPIVETPKNRYERLENRISPSRTSLTQNPADARVSGELEGLLLQKEQSLESNGLVGDHTPSPLVSGFLQQTPHPKHTQSSGSSSPFQLGNIFDTNQTTTRNLGAIPHYLSLSPMDSTSPPYGLDLVWSNWPPNVPHLELLRHL